MIIEQIKSLKYGRRNSVVEQQIENPPWYSEKAGLFGPDYLKEYKDILTATVDEVSFLEKELELKAADKILDCPCGHGRHSVELACRGYRVTGQDLNSFFLEEAERAAKAAEVQIRWSQGDMRAPLFWQEFDVVLNLFTSFGYLETDADDFAALENMRRSLKEGGRLVLDVVNRENRLRLWQDQEWKEFEDGSLLLMERRFDLKTGHNIEKRIRILKDGTRKELDVRVRLYTLTELLFMAGRIGLVPEKFYGDYKGAELTSTSPRYLLVFRKK